jgi:adenine-specific DNA-methyltransferase
MSNKDELNLPLSSPDLTQQNIDKIAELFPNCVTEGPDGKSVDFDLLRQELSPFVVEGQKERYRLEWPGKREAIVTANLPTNKTLRPVREDSVDFDSTENLYIEGDNLEVLKLLQESYLGKIKMIYIDPPYNTGKDFVYKDNFRRDADTELEESGQRDEYNQRLVVNPETSGRYHSDWLSMMYPRLKLARNLLKEDGVIFISIDDNEVHNLRKCCDDIFGENNFISTFIWEKRITRENRKEISTRHDYITCFAKSRSEANRLLGLLPMDDQAKERYKNPDNDPRGDWTSVPAIAQAGHGTKSQFYTLVTPKGRSIDPPSGSCWRYTQTKMTEAINDNRIWFGSDGMGVPRIKKFLSEGQQGLTVESLWWSEDVGTNDSAKRELTKLFDGKAVFETPKPCGLIKRMLEIASDTEELVLDFFSGSAVTAESVLYQNALRGIGLKYILVQIPEKTDEDSEAFKSNFPTISAIGKERIRRAAKKIKEETGADIDYGFRVYRLDSSNLQEVEQRPQDMQQTNLDLFTDNIKPDRTADDLLAQVMLAWGLPLSLRIQRLEINGKLTFKVDHNALYACFEEGIDEDFARAIANEKPLRVVFRDKGFANDTAKINVQQLLRQLSPDTEMRVL